MSKINLTLIIKKEWFDMIVSGEKKVEYRDITEYYIDRIFHKDIHWVDEEQIRDEFIARASSGQIVVEEVESWSLKLKEFDTLTLLNGYQKNKKRATLKLDKVTIDKGNTDWGAKPWDFYFCIHVGELVSTNESELNLKESYPDAECRSEDGHYFIYAPSESNGWISIGDTETEAWDNALESMKNV